MIGRVYQYATASIAMAAGSNYGLSLSGPGASFAYCGGQVTAEFSNSSGTVTGSFVLTTVADGISIVLADTAEAAYHVNPGGGSKVYKNIYLPSIAFTLSFNCRGTGATNQAIVRFLTSGNPS